MNPHTRAHFRLILPLLVGLGLCAPLMIWDLHNQRVIQSASMAWDTGAPAWPYRTADALFTLIALPAYALGWPICKLSPLLQTTIGKYLVIFPVNLIWWAVVGRYLDWWHEPARKRSRLVIFVLGVTVAVLLPFAVFLAEYLASSLRRCGWHIDGNAMVGCVLPEGGGCLWSGLLAAAAIRSIRKQMRVANGSASWPTAIL